MMIALRMPVVARVRLGATHAIVALRLVSRLAGSSLVASRVLLPWPPSFCHDDEVEEEPGSQSTDRSPEVPADACKVMGFSLSALAPL